MEIARVTSVETRSVWSKEIDFSNWLADNIDLLNQELPFDIDSESLRREAAAGGFYVDVVGDSDGGKIVIENQLETTDHRHLGQLLTYASAYDAGAAVWIATQTRPEHSKAIHWLNAESNIDAWLFQLDLVRINESPVAPTLRLVAGPSELSRIARAEKQVDSADRESQYAFWAAALPIVEKECRDVGVFQARNPGRTPTVNERVRGSTGNLSWELWVTGQGSWLSVRVAGESRPEVDHYFDQLVARRQEVDSGFDETLNWDRLEKYKTAIIRWDNDVLGGFRDPSDLWPDAAASLGHKLARLVRVLTGPIEQLEPFVSDTEERSAPESSIEAQHVS